MELECGKSSRHSNGGLFVVTGKEQMSVFTPLNPKSKQQFLSCKPDGVAGVCREAFEEFFHPFPQCPH